MKEGDSIFAKKVKKKSNWEKSDSKFRRKRCNKRCFWHFHIICWNLFWYFYIICWRANLLFFSFDLRPGLSLFLTIQSAADLYCRDVHICSSNTKVVENLSKRTTIWDGCSTVYRSLVSNGITWYLIIYLMVLHDI